MIELQETRNEENDSKRERESETTYKIQEKRIGATLK